MIAYLTRPPLHGAAGPWDELLFLAAFVISIAIFIWIALHDKKRDAGPKEEESKDA